MYQFNFVIVVEVFSKISILVDMPFFISILYCVALCWVDFFVHAMLWVCYVLGI